MNHLSLFSGIGGIDLAAHWAGMQTVAFVEQNKFCQQILAKHWPNVPIFDDVKKLTKDDISEPIDIISGGFPCQPFSNAGKQLGKEDDRHLWPHYSRLIQEFKPRWVVGENVAGIINLALDDVLADLETLGYTSRAFVIPACAVGAHHRRERVFIVAHSDSFGHIHGEVEKLTTEARLDAFSDITASSEDVGNTNVIRLQGRTETIDSQQAQRGIFAGSEIAGATSDNGPGGSWWGFEPAVGRVAHGVSGRVDRLKALGNAVVPQQVFPIMQAIMEIEAMQ
jgi:DNA (cytosine-5)-methyltransferase 1